MTKLNGSASKGSWYSSNYYRLRILGYTVEQELIDSVEYEDASQSSKG